MVREIQTKSLVKLGGRTPSNTVYSRLSQDARFVNVARGAYALATVVGGGGGGGGTAASSPSKFSAAATFGGPGFFGTTTRGGIVGGNMPMGSSGAGGVWQRPAALITTGGTAQGASAQGGGGGSGRGAHVDSEYDMGSVQGDDTPAGATTPMESEVVTDQLGSSSVFSLKLGEPGAQLAAGGRGGAKKDNAAGGKKTAPKAGTGVEALEAELSAGLLMGLRSGGRRASAQQ